MSGDIKILEILFLISAKFIAVLKFMYADFWGLSFTYKIFRWT